MRLVDWPDVRPVTHFTPSSYEEFLTCPLKGYLKGCVEYAPYIYVSPKALMGISVHVVLKRLNTGRYDGVAKDEELTRRIEHEFDEECRKQSGKPVGTIFPTVYESPEY